MNNGTALLDEYRQPDRPICPHCDRERDGCPDYQELMVPSHIENSRLRLKQYEWEREREKIRRWQVAVYGSPLCPYCRQTPIPKRKPGAKGRSAATCGAESCRKALRAVQQRQRRDRASEGRTVHVRSLSRRGVYSPDFGEIVYYPSGSVGPNAMWVFMSSDGNVMAGVGNRLSREEWAVVEEWQKNGGGHVIQTDMLRLEAYEPPDGELLRQSVVKVVRDQAAGRVVGTLPVVPVAA